MGVVSYNACFSLPVQIPDCPQGNPFNHCFMVEIAALIAPESLP